MSKGNKVIHSFLTDINPSHPETQEPKSNIYRGNHAFSEPETRNVRGYLQSLGGKLKGFLDFQNRGSRQWQMPWRYTFTSSSDHDIQVQLDFHPLQIRQGDFLSTQTSPPPSLPSPRKSWIYKIIQNDGFKIADCSSFVFNVLINDFTVIFEDYFLTFFIRHLTF